MPLHFPITLKYLMINITQMLSLVIYLVQKIVNTLTHANSNDCKEINSILIEAKGAFVLQTQIETLSKKMN